MPVKRLKFAPPEEDKFHYFVSSVGEWRTGRDLTELVEKMKRSKLPFHMFFVPLPSTAEYSIKMWEPQVEGRIYLGHYSV